LKSAFGKRQHILDFCSIYAGAQARLLANKTVCINLKSE